PATGVRHRALTGGDQRRVRRAPGLPGAVEEHLANMREGTAQLAQAEEEVPLRNRVVVGAESSDRVHGRPAREEGAIDVESGEEIVGRPVGAEKGRVMRAASVDAVLVRVDDGGIFRAVE